MIGLVIDGTYSTPVSGSNDAPAQFAPPAQPGLTMVPFSEPGVNSGPISYSLTASRAACFNSGVKSIKSLSDTPCRSNAGGFDGIGCVGDDRSPGTVDCGTGFSSIGHTGAPLRRSSTYVKPCLLTCASALIGLPLTLMSTRIGAAG